MGNLLIGLVLIVLGVVLAYALKPFKRNKIIVKIQKKL